MILDRLWDFLLARMSGYLPHAFITGPDGNGMRALGTLGGDESGPTGINNAGQVVGWYGKEGDLHAFITGPDGEGMMDLNSLLDLPNGLVLGAPIDINNAGQVIAWGSIIPSIPEPEIYALLLAGLTVVGFMAQHKKAEVRI